ncbi:Glutamate receptor ionotropic, NMDA 3A, partial [Tyrophagus putrescentiae]
SSSSSSSSAADDASREADELESRIAASDLYRWIVPEFEILNLVPAKRPPMSRRRGRKPSSPAPPQQQQKGKKSLAKFKSPPPLPPPRGRQLPGLLSGGSARSSSSPTSRGARKRGKKWRRRRRRGKWGGGGGQSEWRPVGNITVEAATVNTILYIGADQVPSYISLDGPEFAPNSRPTLYMTNSGKHRFRVVTNIAPPFVIESTKLDNNTCLTGDFCLKIDTNRRDELIALFTDFRSNRRLYEGKRYIVKCCAGIAIDLLNAVARDLHFDYDLYMVADGLFGVKKDGKWDGMWPTWSTTFTAFSTTSSRVWAIDFSVPFFYSGVSCLSATSNETDVPLLAFLIPFSYELWAAIFASLFATAVAAAIYEWFSPFGLNPWGRQRTKNFSLASALWVMCSLLFSHLVAFKAPKSWPNKVLINVWGAFSVIFLATYTANIAAHFAGLFLVPEVNDFHDKSHYKMDTFDEGLELLRAGKLDVLIGDTAILDYYRATDPGCQLRLLGDSIFDDAYAVGMQKGFPFRDSISNLILKYNEYGFLDQLHRKWYGRVHCLESSSLTKPMPLTVRAEAGVFLMLAFGICVGILILFAEHFVFKYCLPGLRRKGKDSYWKTPNLMFFSQKLYRFINTVELVSPHHSAKEIITNLKEGQIASLFQKSVKRKAKEEARRRKSKSQFFELMQEARKIVRQKKEGSQQQDDDDDDDNLNGTIDVDELDIDEEAALNTDANIRVTRPSFSMACRENNSLLGVGDSDSEPVPVGNRVSAIRFKDPEYYDEKQKSARGKKSKKTASFSSTDSKGSLTKRLVSNLKSGGGSGGSGGGTSHDSTSTSKVTSIRKPLGDFSSSYSNETDDGGSHHPHHHHHHHYHHHHPHQQQQSSSKPSSSKDEGTGSKGISAGSKGRRQTMRRSHLLNHSASLSLENLCFPEEESAAVVVGVPENEEEQFTHYHRHRPQQEKLLFPRRRILSFEDLPAIKKELSESSNENGGGGGCYGETFDGEDFDEDDDDDDEEEGAEMMMIRRVSRRTITPPTAYANEDGAPYKSLSRGTKGGQHQQLLPKSNTTPSGLVSAASSSTSTLTPFPLPTRSYSDVCSMIANVGRMGSFSRTDILEMWRTRERETLTELSDVLSQKRALEQKVALLQRMLQKPP